MSYEFQGTSFATEAKWLRAIAQGWLCAGGWNDTDDINDGWIRCNPPPWRRSVLMDGGRATTPIPRPILMTWPARLPTWRLIESG